MNNGFFGFPIAASSSNVLSIKEYDYSGTFLIPEGTKRIWIMAVGGGGGGGGGARRATTSYGGGGGAGGGIIIYDYAIDALGLPGTTLTIAIGAGGGGGTGGASDGTDGTNGLANGGATTVTITGKPGFLMVAGGGGVGGGGGTAAGTGGGAVGYFYQGFNTNITNSPTNSGAGATSTTAANGPSAGIGYSIAANGGAAGGGVFSGVATVGGALTAGSPIYTGIFNPYWGAGNNQIQPPAANQATGATHNTFLTAIGLYGPGIGGGGGSGGASVSANNAANGYRGGGGGGGGGSTTGIASGNGGNGGNGYVVIVAYK